MDKYGDFNSKKFLGIILLICVVFLVLIMKAFDYLPEAENQQIEHNISDINTPAETSSDNDVTENENLEKELTNKSETKVLEIDTKNVAEPTEKLEVLESLNEDSNSSNIESSDVANKPVELTPEEKAEKLFMSASNYKKNKDFVKALGELNKIPTVTNDTSTVARCCEEIATIYAIVKRYGTALSYAQKAYNMAPSSSREMLLARIYYKTGEMDKATRRINNVLQRDFSADR